MSQVSLELVVRTEKNIIQECRKRLLSLKEDLLNRVGSHKLEISAQDKSAGDEVDQMLAQQQENDFVLAQQRLRTLLMEIDFALGRIRAGTFGICEETEEPIETERLLALPYTRLSIEGAEIRDAMKSKFAR